MPNEGDAEVVVRSTKDTTEYRFPIGEPPPGFGSGTGSAVAFSGTAAWVALTTYPTAAQAKKLRAGKKTPRNGVKLVSLTDGSAVQFDEIRTFSFSGERGDWTAPHRLAPEAPSGGSSAPKIAGTDLIVRELATRVEIVLGNVSEFGFDRAGDRPAWLVERETSWATRSCSATCAPA